MKQAMTALAAGIALAGFALCASAQAPAPSYSNEVSVFGSWEDVREPADIEQSNLYLRYGRVVAPQLVGTVGLQRTRFKAGGSDATTTAFTVGAKYYVTALTTRQIVPFVEASVGLANSDTGSSDSNDFTWEFGGGVSWFFTPATSFDAGLRLFHTSTDVDTKGTRMFVGITTRF
jgi:hypothetical protein